MGYEFEMKEIDPQPIVAIRTTTTTSQLGKGFSEWLPAVRAYLEKRGLEATGPAVARYHEFREDFVDVEAGYPIEDPGGLEAEDTVTVGELPGGTVAVTWHIGSYDTLSQAFDDLHSWIHEQGKDESPGPWESYVVGPAEEHDSSKWRTEIRWPVGG